MMRRLSIMLAVMVVVTLVTAGYLLFQPPPAENMIVTGYIPRQPGEVVRCSYRVGQTTVGVLSCVQEIP